MSGKLEVICGSMFSGKTEELLRRMNRFKYSKKDYILFKTQIDNRYSEDKVVSHNKNELSACVVDSVDELLEVCKKNPHIKNVGIDEVQFLIKTTSIPIEEAVYKLKKEGYHILVAGLDMDAMGRPFGCLPFLLAIADSVYKLKAVCFDCGEDASMSHRMNNSKDIVQIGAADKYKALCPTCWVTQNP